MSWADAFAERSTYLQKKAVRSIAKVSKKKNMRALNGAATNMWPLANFGTVTSKKLCRDWPLTAAFGWLRRNIYYFHYDPVLDWIGSKIPHISFIFL